MSTNNATTNTDAVGISDRQAPTGPQPDQTPVGPAATTSVASGVTQITAGSNVTISPVGGTGNVTVNAVLSSGVTQIVAGTNISVSPVGGTGVVTVNAGAGTGTVTSVAAGSGITCSPSPIVTSGTVSLANSQLYAETQTTLLGNPTGSTAAPVAISLGTGLAFSGTTLNATGATFPAKATILTNASAVPINTRNIFNVQAYGAVGDGATNDTSAIGAAMTAFAANTSGKTLGTLYFPPGTYLISAQLSITMATIPFSCSIVGEGQYASIIYQTTAGQSGLIVQMTNSESRCIVEGLGFQAAAGVVCNAAVEVSYTSFVGNETFGGSVVQDIDIGAYDGGSGNWNFGVYCSNPWKMNIHRINGTGVGNVNAVPTNGSALVYIGGGTNVLISDCYGSYWQYGLNMQPSPTTGLVAQGVIITSCIFVDVNFGTYLAPTTSNSGFASSFQLSNILVDQGNAAPPANAVGFYFDCTQTAGTIYPINAGQVTITGCFCTQNNTNGGTRFIYAKMVKQLVVNGNTYYTGGRFATLDNGTTSAIFIGNQAGGSAAPTLIGTASYFNTTLTTHWP